MSIPQVPRAEAETGDHPVDLLPVELLPLVHDDAASVTAVLVVRPPQPAIDGGCVVGLGAALQSTTQHSTAQHVSIDVGTRLSCSAVVEFVQ